MAKRGAKSKYNPDVHPRAARWLLRDGFTIEQMAKDPFFNVAKRTIYHWGDKHPEFLRALNGESRRFVDYNVEDSLLKRALGFEYTETEETKTVDKKGKARLAKVRTITKTVIPDTKACIRWLMNRKPDEWREAKPGLSDKDTNEVLKAIARELQEDQAG